MPIADLPILGGYDKQRFLQFSPEDSANWTLVQAPSGKKKTALYPAMGRKHINFNGQNRLIFPGEPRGIFRSVNFMYYVVGSQIFRVDAGYNVLQITSGNQVETIFGSVFFAYLIVTNQTFVIFVDGQKIYVYEEPVIDPDGMIVSAGGFFVVTDPNAPQFPTYVASFGSRIVVSSYKSSQFTLSNINLDGQSFNAGTCFTSPTGFGVFAQAPGEIKQFGVLFNQLFIFTDFTTSIWSNIQSNIQSSSSGPVTTFPWKQSSSYNWDYGMADPLSLDIDFHKMIWLAKNQNGIVQVMISDGGVPQKLSTKAIDVLFQKDPDTGEASPYLMGNSNGFLYQYENTIYYRLSAGDWENFPSLDNTQDNNSIEFNFDTNTWSRCIELNGARNRIQKHMFFNGTHYVTVEEESTVYEMSGQFYTNDLRNENQPNPQAPDAYLPYPFRYEKVTPIIFQEDYSEFITDYVQIDFVFGEETFTNSTNPFENTVFMVADTVAPTDEPLYLVTEDSDPNNSDDQTFLIKENSNFPTLNSKIYNKLFKPNITLYFSDDGGISYNTADNREFSQLGVYSWRMRWYQLGPSRNRVYKLVCVSPSPIVVLGGVMEMRRSSGGAN